MNDNDVIDFSADVDTSVEARKIVIPYIPRTHFKRLHNSKKRWKFVCAHRRAGKSVSMINEMIKAALTNPRVFPIPRYAYVGPSFAQTKDLIWGYLKHYTSVFEGVKYSESDLECILPNGAKITLYGGAAAYERMRGLYFDGIVLDEFPLLNPTVFSTVVRPCLADYRGWAIISGTSAGDDHFHELKKKNEKDPTWEFIIIPVTETDALHPDEVQEMTKDMTPAEYAREMLCDFNAPIEGAYYAEIMNKLKLQNRVTNVPYDPAALVYTFWDLGIDDLTAIWFVQRVGREYHAIDFLGGGNKSLEQWCGEVKTRKSSLGDTYIYGGHIFPHDVEARELGTGKTRIEIARGILDDCMTCTMHRVEDGIAAVKSSLSLFWFDKTATEEGVAAMSNYQKTKTGKPLHNWASHAADAFRTGCMMLNLILGGGYGANVIPINGPLRRKIRGIV